MSIYGQYAPGEHPGSPFSGCIILVFVVLRWYRREPMQTKVSATVIPDTFETSGTYPLWEDGKP